jgi:hypothetical protein
VAASQGHLKVVNLLLERNSEVDHQDRDGTTPLLVAAFEGHKSVLISLLGRWLLDCKFLVASSEYLFPCVTEKSVNFFWSLKQTLMPLTRLVEHLCGLLLPWGILEFVSCFYFGEPTWIISMEKVEPCYLWLLLR